MLPFWIWITYNAYIYNIYRINKNSWIINYFTIFVPFSLFPRNCSVAVLGFHRNGTQYVLIEMDNTAMVAVFTAYRNAIAVIIRWPTV